MVLINEPTIKTELVETELTPVVGSAGTAAILGDFERGNQHEHISAKDIRTALAKMGDNKDYSGIRSIYQIFKQDRVVDNIGATGSVLVQTGSKKKATSEIKNDPDEGIPKTIINIETISGGKYGDNISYSISEGTKTDYKFVLTYQDKIVYIIDNVNPKELVIRINARKQFIQATHNDTVDQTLELVTDVNLSGGEDSETITNEDLHDSLLAIKDYPVDLITFSDILDEDFIGILVDYLDQRFEDDNPSIAIVALDPDESIDYYTRIMNEYISRFIIWSISPIRTASDDELDAAETAARHTGYIAGMKVNKSPTNKLMSDVTGLHREFTPLERDILIQNGAYLLKKSDPEKNEFRIVNAVTGETRLNNKGEKLAQARVHVVRTVNYCVNYFNLRDWLGETGISQTIAAIQGETSQRKKNLLDPNDPIVENIEVVPQPGESNNDIAVDMEVQALGVVEFIHKRVKVGMG